MILSLPLKWGFLKQTEDYLFQRNNRAVPGGLGKAPALFLARERIFSPLNNEIISFIIRV